MTKEHPKDNTECNDELHREHLCYFISQGFHATDTQRYNDMVTEPNFKCLKCGRVAKSDKSLCEPVSLFV